MTKVLALLAVLVACASAEVTGPSLVTAGKIIKLTGSTSTANDSNYNVLRWTGATGAKVDIWRNGARLTATPNDGYYVNVIRHTGIRTIRYDLCPTGRTTGCSNRVMITTVAPTAPPPPPPPPASTLRALATARGFEIGTAVRDSPFASDAQYKAILTAQYNSIGTEDATDFWPIHPGPTQYNFGPADALVAYAQANGMKFHGHTLIWGSWIPTWVTSGGFSRDSLFGVMKSHITTVVTRYKGQALSWDVLNEMLDNWPGTTVKPSFWLTQLGPAYMDSAFVWARRADPSAKLYINDYLTEFPSQKSDFLFSLVQGFRARGVPIDGVGFQLHISNGHPDWAGYATFNANPVGPEFQATLQRFANAGYDIRITELDIEIADDAPAPAALEKQGRIYRDVLDGCLKVSRCKELTTWGFTDKYHWLPSGRPGFGRGVPFDVNYQKKPAFDSLLARLGRP